jgi:hypothetical protein
MMHRHRSESSVEKELLLKIKIENIKQHMNMIVSMIENLEKILLSRKYNETIVSDNVITDERPL